MSIIPKVLYGIGTSFSGKKAEFSASLISPDKMAAEIPIPRLSSILLYRRFIVLGGEIILIPSDALFEMLTLDMRGDFITL